LDAQDDLRRAARAIFDATLTDLDARAATRRALDFKRGRLNILDAEFNLNARPLAIYSIAIGKAAAAMASALDETLGDALAGGVVSAPPSPKVQLSERWQLFAGGHPLPNEASLEAARAAFKLLGAADREPHALVIFLISGGGSAMLEWPRDESITLADLRAANQSLVSCGARIDEINCVRRALSSVKGGGLSACAMRAAQISLIISDTNPDEPHNVASGPTFAFSPEPHALARIIAHYGLAATLPPSVFRAVRQQAHSYQPEIVHASTLRRHHVLLDNERALVRASEIAAARGFAVEVARDISEQHVAVGASLLVSRLFDLHRKEGGRPVCLVSGGEFSCPVRGEGVGGRNAETVMRCAFEIESQLAPSSPDAKTRIDASRTFDAAVRVAALSAGTDGIDGNSPAAGALCDDTTLARARARSLDARKFLEASDAHTFFATLGDAVHTGATGTNVRDLRLLLAQ
jgi:hydroxypyruvate reductase